MARFWGPRKKGRWRKGRWRKKRMGVLFKELALPFFFWKRCEKAQKLSQAAKTLATHKIGDKCKGTLSALQYRLFSL